MSELGIKMPDVKKSLLESRLRKRLRALNIDSFKDYCDYLFSPWGMKNELVHAIDMVTTNKTDFFREPYHFDFLSRAALPDLARKGAGARRPLSVWSAGCSSGEEPYTLAIVLSEFSRRFPGFDFSITATDISARVLDAARNAIYREERIAPVSMELRKRYFLKSKDRARRLVMASPELRGRVNFKRLNLMDEDLGFANLDVIFCRNVVIYFDRETQLRLFRKLCGCLGPGGYLFIGHSETMTGLDLKFEKVGQSIYRRVR
ncbi:MAG: protein-glutamate O-methyltransferase [Deltaproteobacteria bacterium]|nr:protein-glutamate O-methyltransferase [Deltaproteobacteria bacterium]